METTAAIVPASAASPSLTTDGVMIPLQHHENFYALPEAERERVQFLMRICNIVAASELGTTAALRLQAANSGMSFGNLKTLYYAWKTTKDWRIFVRRWRGPQQLPRAFVEEVRRRMEKNGRSMKKAIESIRDDFRNGDDVPGYGTWRAWYQLEFPERDLPAQLPFGVFPAGWSQSNLYTKAPSKAERALATRGWAAAKRYLPHVMRDMSGLRFLELIVIDDFETDVLVQARNPATGAYEIVPCKGLLAIDGATRRVLAWALKPKFTKSAAAQEETGAKRHGLTHDDVKNLLYSVFSGHGLPKDYGCTILCENATASISGDFELSLETLFGVQVAKTGLMAREAKTLRNGFVQGGGKPFEKGWIESFFNLVWNYAGALPGQKGATYQLRPADLAAKVLYAEKLLNLDGLTTEQVAELQTGFFTVDQLCSAFDFIFSQADNRTKHALQGFDEVVDAYLLPDGSASVSRDEAQLLPRETLLACKPLPRMQSPMERWAKVTAGVDFIKVPEYALQLLLLTPKPVTLENHKITFSIAGKGYTFFDADSPVHQLPEGTKLLGYFDGSAAGTLYCTHLDGRYAGKLKRHGRVDIRDAAKISEQAGEVSRLIAKHVLNPVRERHALENVEIGAAKDHNRALCVAWGVREKDLPPAAAPAPREKSPSASPAAKSISDKLGRKQPSRDAFTAYQDALARGIAEQEQQRAEAAAIIEQDRARAAALTPEDRAAFNPAAITPQTASAAKPESLDDYT